MDLINAFIDDVESHYNIKTEKLSVATKWERNPPGQAINATIKEYLEDVRYCARYFLDPY